MYLRVLDNTAQSASPGTKRRKDFAKSHLEVTMFDVGSGEAVLVVFPGKRAWLIEAGRNSDPRNVTLGNKLVAHLSTQNLTLEAVVLSHAHSDHAGAATTFLPLLASPQAPVIVYRPDHPTWDRSPDPDWLQPFRGVVANTPNVNLQTVARGILKFVPISGHQVNARLFVGQATDSEIYTSLFVQLRFHGARLLFTGDVKTAYEDDIVEDFPGDLPADVLKITHHGSNSGTGKKLIKAVQPGIAIASTSDHGSHRLETVVRTRLGGERKIYETLKHGDITLRTDGKPYKGGGLLYEVEHS